MISLDALVQDLRYALRQIGRSPGFASAVILTLALGIGANAAVYSLLNAIVLRSIPAQDPDRLVALSCADARGQQPRSIYIDTFELLRTKQHVFESVSLYSGGGQLLVEAKGIRAPALIESGTPEYYEVLGVRPFLGRFISGQDTPRDVPSAPVVVIGYRLWQQRFGADPKVLGQTLTVEDMPLTIIGVTPPDFPGLQVDSGADFSVTMWALRKLAGDPKRPLRAWNIIARLKPGVSLEQARAEVTTLWPGVQAATLPPGLTTREQEEMRAQVVRVESISTGFSTLRTRYGTALFLLSGFAVVMLILACVNLSGLFLARTVARRLETAVCFALGATRARVVQRLLVECIVLAGLGGVLAVPFAWWVSDAFVVLVRSGAGQPLFKPATPDLHVLIATGAVAVGTAVLMATLPAWMALTRGGALVVQPTRSVTSNRGWASHVLLAVQVALSLTLLFGAGLLGRTLANLRSIDIGARSTDVVWTRVFAVPGGYTNFDDVSYYPELARRLAAIPGVRSVGLSRLYPSAMILSNSRIFRRVGTWDSRDAPGDIDALVEGASPQFFETVGIPLIRGRQFTWNDDRRSAPIAIISQSLERRLFPLGDAIGRRIRVDNDPKKAIEVVGIAGDAAIGNLREPYVGVVFRPILQDVLRVPVVTLRTSASPAAMREPISRTVLSMGREYAQTITSIEEQLDRTLLQERLLAMSSLFLAALAIVLAGLGLYAALAYSVVQRTREIGVRIALGASSARVLRMVVGRSLIVTLVGVLVGIGPALAVGRTAKAFLFQVSASDPILLTATAVFFIAVGLVAAIRPAYRAANVDPMTALRAD
jgi:putative ABC transport system permease protein